MDIRDSRIQKAFDWLAKENGENFLSSDEHCSEWGKNFHYVNTENPSLQATFEFLKENCLVNHYYE